MPRRVIDAKGMPTALGPYSNAVAASGELVFVSGQPGMNVATGEIPDNFEAQARLAFANLEAVLRAADLELADVVKTTIYVTDAENFGILNQVFGEIFPTSPPTRAVPVVSIPKGLLVSVEAIAVRG